MKTKRVRYTGSSSVYVPALAAAIGVGVPESGEAYEVPASLAETLVAGSRAWRVVPASRQRRPTERSSA